LAGSADDHITEAPSTAGVDRVSTQCPSPAPAKSSQENLRRSVPECVFGLVGGLYGLSVRRKPGVSLVPRSNPTLSDCATILYGGGQSRSY